MDKIKKLINQIRKGICRSECLKAEYEQWKIQVENYKTEITKSEKLLAELHEKLAEIEKSIPDFDMKTYEKYKEYYNTEKEISDITKHQKHTTEHIECLYDRLTSSLSQQILLAESIKSMQKELEQLKTTEEVDRLTLKKINMVIEECANRSDLTGIPDKVYDFIENTEMFYAFLKYSKKKFFKKYPYLTQQEYDLTLFAINNDAINILLNFIDNTGTKELAEPYNLTPGECKQAAVNFAKKYFRTEQFEEFVNAAEKREIYL